MRHVWSLLSGIAVTAAVAALMAIDLHDAHGWSLARLAAVGVLLGLIATPRISPLGPMVAGLALLAPIVLMETASGAYADIFTRDSVVKLGSLGEMSWPELGKSTALLATVGVLLLVSVVSAQRWRRWPEPGALVDNGQMASAEPWTRAVDDTMPDPAGAHDGTTAQLWVPPPTR